jgi:ribokinase
MKLGKDALKGIYERTNIFFSNVEEAERILGINTLGISELLKRMHELGPKIVIITDGPKGAYAYDGEKFLFQPPYPDQAPAFERTGAGDAFASTVVVALALGKDLSTALMWGSVNAMSVVQQIGAQRGLLNESQLNEYLNSASAEFQTKPL